MKSLSLTRLMEERYGTLARVPVRGRPSQNEQMQHATTY